MFIVPLYLKYSPVGIIPEHLADVAHPDALVECLGGEVIKMVYEECYDIHNEQDLDAINQDVRRIYGENYSFHKMLAVWGRRRPDLELRRWYRIRMVKDDRAARVSEGIG